MSNKKTENKVKIQKMTFSLRVKLFHYTTPFIFLKKCTTSASKLKSCNLKISKSFKEVNHDA